MFKTNVQQYVFLFVSHTPWLARLDSSSRQRIPEVQTYPVLEKNSGQVSLRRSVDASLRRVAKVEESQKPLLWTDKDQEDQPHRELKTTYSNQPPQDSRIKLGTSSIVVSEQASWGSSKLLEESISLPTTTFSFTRSFAQTWPMYLRCFIRSTLEASHQHLQRILTSELRCLVKSEHSILESWRRHTCLSTQGSVF